MLRAMVERMGSGLADSAAADYLPLQTGFVRLSRLIIAPLCWPYVLFFIVKDFSK
jgi:hypothetical protein